MSNPNLLPFALPEICNDELNEVAGVLASGWITTGPKTDLFEKEFTGFVGAPFCLAVDK